MKTTTATPQNISFAIISTDKIKYNIGEYLWNYWQNNHDIESIRNAEKTLRSEIEIGLRRQFNDFCEY